MVSKLGKNREIFPKDLPYPEREAKLGGIERKDLGTNELFLVRGYLLLPNIRFLL